MANPTLIDILGANGVQTIVAGTDLNGLASGSAVVAATVWSNVTGDGKGGGLPFAVLKLHIDSMAVSAGGVVDGWFLTASDGSVYSQGSASIIPLRPPDFILVPVVQTAAVDCETVFAIPVPICATQKILLRNNALGASFPANNNAYLKAYPTTDSYPSI
jgi:hypothetical protein